LANGGCVGNCDGFIQFNLNFGFDFDASDRYSADSALLNAIDWTADTRTRNFSIDGGLTLGLALDVVGWDLAAVTGVPEPSSAPWWRLAYSC
jgi:hypothetical protein